MASSRGSGGDGSKPTFLSKFFPSRSSSSDNKDSAKEESHGKRTTRGALNDKTKSSWPEWKSHYLSLTVEKRREIYKCKQWHVLDNILTWPMYYEKNKAKLLKQFRRGKYKINDRPKVNEKLNTKVTVWKGDITALEIDCIVNAANESLLGGGGVDGAIHSAAGKMLVAECHSLQGCDTGKSKISGGYKLPAKYIIHTVGPMRHGDGDLISCYNTSYELMQENKLKSIAFPCVSTGIYGFPNIQAAHIALSTTREFLEKHGDEVDRVIFCVFLSKDVEIYECLMQEYFPVTEEEPTDEETDTTKVSKDEEDIADDSSKESRKLDHEDGGALKHKKPDASTIGSKDTSKPTGNGEHSVKAGKDGVEGDLAVEEPSPATPIKNKAPSEEVGTLDSEETSKDDKSPNAKKEKISDSPTTQTLKASRM